MTQELSPGTLFTETLYETYGQSFTVDKVLFEHKTHHQHLVIFENNCFGTVMALDGIIQTTDKDEFSYHEMLTHVPLFSHPNPQKVLIIGGGDGGILREVVKHPRVKSVTQVEIDHAVIDMCKKYFPQHSDGAYDNDKVTIVIDDGAKFVEKCDEKFDVIISDSTDPIGPGEVLFTSSFYQNQKKCLNKGGIVVAQNGVAFMQIDEVQTTYQRLQPLYKDVTFYTTAVPTYIGGLMTLAWASDNEALKATDLKTLEERFAEANITTQYYTPQVHLAAFALPQFIQKIIC